jgi:hypothetical protein
MMKEQAAVRVIPSVWKDDNFSKDSLSLEDALITTRQHLQ